MKKVLFHALPVSIILVLLLSFTRKETSFSVNSRHNTDSTGSIRFVINSAESVQKHGLNARIQIVDAKNEHVVYHSVVSLVSEKGMLVTPPIVLKKGQYRLIEFFVTDKKGEVSEMASRVTNEFITLPSLFVVNP